MKKIAFLLIALVTLWACHPEDRSGEQPFKPEVANATYEILGDSCRLHGVILSSPNSDVLGCGFVYGNDTLRIQAIADSCSMAFSVVTKPLEHGDYYAVAFAENGMGRSSAPDSMHFTIPEH